MHLDAMFDRVRASGVSNEQINALEFLLNNLRAIDAQLATIESVQTTASARNNTEMLLANDRPGGLNDIWSRLRRNMSPESVLFRHTVHVSLVLRAGYTSIQSTGLQHGYWALPTSLFVCQPNYNVIRHRLALRTIDTLVGVAISLPVLLLVPSTKGQLVLVVSTSVLFIAFHSVQYAHATMFIMLLMLPCFNLLGEGSEATPPYITDTLTGYAIAWATVSFIWPDWKFCNLLRVLDRATNANCCHLDTILERCHQGRDNRLVYRIARRDACNYDAELAFVVSNLSIEPRAGGAQHEVAFRLPCPNHTFTSYISALDTHREKPSTPDILTLLDDTVCYVDDALHHIPADEHRVQKSLTGL